MAKFSNYRLIDYYKERYLNKTFIDTLLYCVPCDLHFTVNILDANGHGVICPRCQSEDLIEVGSAQVKLVEIWNEDSGRPDSYSNGRRRRRDRADMGVLWQSSSI